MLPRRKNLLEAFKKTDAAGAPLPEASSSHLPPSSAPGPLFDSALSGSSLSAPRPAFALIAIGLVLAFVAGFAVGRSSGGEARAEEPESERAAAPKPAPPANQPRAFQERPGAPTPGVAQDGEPQTLEESALFDPKNLQTVVVASYSKSNQDFAWATYEHLREARLPVFPPIESRNLVVVLAGAAPTAAELAATEAAVRALSRDGKKKDYVDAYTVRIDTLIPRNKTKDP